jgi:hypothetical protein
MSILDPNLKLINAFHILTTYARNIHFSIMFTSNNTSTNNSRFLSSLFCMLLRQNHFFFFDLIIIILFCKAQQTIKLLVV